MCGFCMMDTDCRDEETCDTATLQCVSGGSSGGGDKGCTDTDDGAVDILDDGGSDYISSWCGGFDDSDFDFGFLRRRVAGTFADL